MKVRELIEYRNVDIVDIDDEFYNRGKNIWRQVSPSCKSSDDCTEEEYERFLEKRVVDFKVKQSNTIPAIYISDPIEARQLGYYVCATVSKYTEEELEERRKQKEIDNKIAELTRLTGREVVLGEEHAAEKTGIIFGD